MIALRDVRVGAGGHHVRGHHAEQLDRVRWKTARAQRAKDEHPPPHHGPRPRRELTNAHIVVPRRRGSVKAKLVVRPRALMPEAIWSMKPNMQSAADASRTWPRVAYMVCLDRGVCSAECRHVQDINIFVSDVPRDINVCQWNRARRLSRYIQLITRTDNGVL